MKTTGSKAMIATLILMSSAWNASAADWTFQSQRSPSGETTFSAGTEGLQFSCTSNGRPTMRVSWTLGSSVASFPAQNLGGQDATIGVEPRKTGMLSRFTSSSAKGVMVKGRYDTGAFGKGPTTSATVSGRQALDVAAGLLDFDVAKLTYLAAANDGSITIPLAGAAGPIRQLLQACGYHK